jgi:hypothetical protein
MTTRTFTIEALADITKYAEGMAKIPGVTQKQAAAASLKFAAELNKGMTKAVAEAEREARAAASAVGDAFVVTAGDIASAMRGVWEFARSIADLQAEIAQTAARSGIASDTLRGLDLALRGAGLTLRDLEGDLNQFPKKMVEAAEGGNAAADSFGALGISVTDASGKLRSADAVFTDTLSALAQVADPAQRAALALELMGEGGARLQQTGALGNLGAFVDLTARFGVETGPAATRSAVAFAQGLATLQTVAQGAAARVLAAFTGGAGSMASGVDAVTRGVIILSAGLQAMGELFADRVASLLIPLEALAVAIDRGPSAAVAFMRDNWGDFTAGVLKTINPIVGGVELVNRATSIAAENLEAFSDLSAATTAAAAAGTRELALAQGQAQAASKGATAAAADAAKAQEELRRAIADAASDTVTAEERVRAAYLARVDGIAAAERAGGDAFSASLARSEAEARLARDLSAIQIAEAERAAQGRAAALAAIGQAQTPEQVMALRDAELERINAVALADLDNLTRQAELHAQFDTTRLQAEQRLRDIRRQGFSDMASAAGDLAGNTAQAFAFAAQQMAAAGNKAAIAMFRAGQVAAVAQVGFAVAEGIARVAAIAATRPALAAVAGASLAVAQGTALGMIAAQKPPTMQTFDTGGEVRGGSASPMTQTAQQVAVRAVPGEVVVDSATANRMGGASGVQAALAAMGAGQGAAPAAAVALDLTPAARRLLRPRKAPGTVTGHRPPGAR